MMDRAVNTALDDICGEIGFTATLALVAWFGQSGNNVFVPKVAHKGQLLVALLGLPMAAKLSQAWGGEHITVPSMAAYENMARKRFICRLLESGFSWGEVGLRLDMSERRVQQIAQELQGQGLMAKLPAKKRGRKSAAELQGKVLMANLPPKKYAQETGAKTPQKNGRQETGGSSDATSPVAALPTSTLPMPVVRTVRKRRIAPLPA